MDEHLLDAYADVCLTVGLGFAPGQRIAVQGYDAGVPLECAPFARRIIERAYRSGASLVNVLWEDVDERRLRHTLGPAETAAEVLDWQQRAFQEPTLSGYSIFCLAGDAPTATAGIELARADGLRKAIRAAIRPAREIRGRSGVPWLIAGVATGAWAADVFGDLPAAEGVEALWTAILHATRADQADPIAAWQTHLQSLARRKAELTSRQFDALHFRGPGTDLHIGLVSNHLWGAGTATTPGGVVFVPNLPTEETWTMPHRLRVDGTVRGTIPAAIGGVVVEGWSLEFAGGRCVRVDAESNAAALRSVVETDEGSCRLGEVALVSADSPVGETGVLFKNTLYDENVACHIALGSCYPTNLVGGAEMEPEALEALGANARSAEHCDVMIGSGEVDVDGIGFDGAVEAVMRGGRFVGAFA